ncbi:kinase-like protein [Jaminaea rosea]|uniref:Kinase-like protein n=1 Tax=Jaminaea rosea TaxID=1569628 RepID=A0A316UXY7_9BASI|nr:kinase-like protein [Jaminaea rosea]PWN30170.1 kinase-like protein [Jaminaea rosea]
MPQHLANVSGAGPSSSSSSSSTQPPHLVPNLLPKLETAPHAGDREPSISVLGLDEGTGVSASSSSSAYPRSGSNGSLAAAPGSRTASFFAAASSSPVLSPASVVSQQGHNRTASASSAKSLTSLPPSLLAPEQGYRSQRLSHKSSTGTNASVWSGDSQSSDAGHGGVEDEATSSRRFRSPASGGPSAGISTDAAGNRLAPTLIRLPTPTDFQPDHQLHSASSIRSRRNWDEFEGKPILPLPSPAVQQDALESGDSMFVGLDEQQHSAPSSQVLFSSPGNTYDRHANGQPSSSPFLSAPSTATNSTFSAASTAYTSQPAPPSPSPSNRDGALGDGFQSSAASSSKTKSFFGSGGQSSPIPPPARAPSLRSPRSSTSEMSRHARTASGQSDASQSWNNTLSPAASPAGFKTGFPTLPSVSSSLASSADQSPATGPAALPRFQRPSRYPTLPSQEGGSISGLDGNFRTPMRKGTGDSTITSSASNASLAPSSSFQADSSDSVRTPQLSSAYTEGFSSIGKGPPPAFDSTGKAAKTRHVHGPSENATGSSLIPPFDNQQTDSPSPAMPKSTPSALRLEGLPSHPLSTHAESLSIDVSAAEASRAKQQQQQQQQYLGADGPLSSPRVLARAAQDAAAADEESEDEAVGRVGTYRVQKTLGVGAFSRVVLAAPIVPTPIRLSPAASDTEREGSGGESREAPMKKKSSLQSWSKAFRSKSSSPAPPLSTSSSSSSTPKTRGITTTLAPPANITASDAEPEGAPMYALKMMAREPFEQNERMKVSWVREVEVLRHIHHPSLIHFIKSFSTPRHHVLVLERVAGGELFDVLWSHKVEMAKREWFVRRLFAELANAVGWMHSINLVHRDIKLENIILTRDVFADLDSLRPSRLGGIPLLKLTDFGLSRFIDASKPMLETRCGSEEYASPELIIGKKYDGRKTDVWAMGVVLYALVCGMLPFLDQAEGGGGASQENREGARRERGPKERKAHLLRIAKGDLRWPLEVNDEPADSPAPSLCPASNRLITPYAKHLISRLLRRDATKRAQAWECFDDPWLTHGSFHAHGEVSAHGEAIQKGEGCQLGLPPDPRSEEGQAWLRERAEVRGGDVSLLAKHD